MQSITIILAALLSVIATVDGSHQDLNSNAEQRQVSIEAQPDSPLLLKDLSTSLYSRSMDRPSYIRGFDLDLTFYAENKSDKVIVAYTFALIEPDGMSEVSTLRLRTVVPYETTAEDSSSVRTKGKPLTLRLELISFEDGTTWKAKSFPFPWLKQKKQRLKSPDSGEGTI